MIFLLSRTNVFSLEIEDDSKTIIECFNKKIGIPYSIKVLMGIFGNHPQI